MTHRTPPHRFAGTAIAAVLALGSTPLWAQDASQASGSVAAPVAVPAQPTIVLPDVTAAPVAPVVVAPVPEPVVAVPVAARAAPRNAAPIARSAPVRAAVAPAASAEPAPTAPVDVALEPVIEPVDVAAVDESAVAAPADETSSDILPLAGLLAALGLGGIALFAGRRRRRQPDEVAPVIVAREPAPVLPPRPAAATGPIPAPSFVAPALTLQQFAQPAAQPTVRPAWQEPRRAGTPALAQSSQLNRQALLERMVAAEPDANNPFTSAKGRHRRARLMLQSMDNQRWDDTELAQGFDWRELARATREREAVDA